MLQISNFTFAYDKADRSILNNLSVNFTSGINIILGPNGAGKSTLLKCIFGLLHGQGDIIYDGCPLNKLPVSELVNTISFLPQIDNNNSTLSALEMVLLGKLPELGCRVTAEDLNGAMHIMKILHIEHIAMSKMNELSGGQQKIIYIAQALIGSPRLLLMDEPLNSLDLQKQLELCQLLQQLVNSYGIDIIMVLHDINLAARYAQNIVILNSNGELYDAGISHKVINTKMLADVYGIEADISIDKFGIPTISALCSLRNIVLNS